MISYSPFWNTLKEKGVSTYTLINKHKVSSSTLTRLRKNRPLSTVTIDDLCTILDCDISDVAIFIKSDESSD